ncbi:hypothetical protein [Mycobacterium sp. MMS18-G62]
MNAPQYGQQPYGQPYYGQPREGIAITTQYSVLAWLYAAITPKIFLNGHDVPIRGWGRTVLPLAPGQYHVHVYIPYWLPSRAGTADYTAVVNPGQWVELDYKAPLITFSRGSLGPPPQSYNGIGVMVAIAVVSALFVLALAVLLLTTG